ncbi:MAG: signal transduction histidine kinase [Saprospiraceae bacterium]|jgi:signal transduction histidine kinase
MHNMVRWFSIGVITYLIIGITWWGLLLFRETTISYNLKIAAADENELTTINEEYRKDKMKIFGEGLFLGFSILAGVYIIYRSANREIGQMKQQGDFLLSVSHELKSPIAAMKLALQTLIRPNLPPATSNKITHSAIKDADRLEQLVQNILLSASLDEKQLELFLEPTDISKLLYQIVEEFRSKADTKKIIFKSEYEGLSCQLDKSMIKQAVVNILQNAIKYAESESDIHVLVKEVNKKVEIEIRNKGPQIKFEERSEIFERFYRGNDPMVRNKEGTGIGLYISKEIIGAHRGDIKIRSNEQESMTSFIIELPIHE